MDFLPSYPKHDYLFPLTRSIAPIYQDLHLDLVGRRHDQLLREQAEIERLVRTSRVNNNGGFAEAYEREVRQKQMRIAELLRKDAVFGLQRQQMKRTLLEEQLNYEQMLSQMEANHYSLLNKRRTAYLGGHHPRHISVLGLSNTGDVANKLAQNTFAIEERAKSLNKHKLKEGNEHTMLDQSVFKTQNAKGKFLKQYEKNGWSNRSQVVKPVLKESKQQITHSKQPIGQNQQNKYAELDFKTHRSVSSAQPKTNRVSFDLSANITSSPKSQAQNSQFLKPNSLKYSPQKPQHAINASDLKSRAQQKIQNRMKLSQIVYRDSQLRNIKHEVAHLASTFQTELNLRKGLRLRINNEPTVIAKYSIVVEKQ